MKARIEKKLSKRTGVTPAQGARIAELMDEVRAADAQDPYWSESSRTARDTARRNYSDYINEIGATKSDLFRLLKGPEPCCEDYQPESVRAASVNRASDGTLYSTAGILWCRNCGALIRNGSEVTRPMSPNAQTVEQDIQKAINDAPEALRELGAYLAMLLDEDRWPEAERKLLAAIYSASRPSEQQPDATQLVEALEQVIKSAPSGGPLWHGSEQIVEARAALAAYRKGGEQ